MRRSELLEMRDAKPSRPKRSQCRATRLASSTTLVMITMLFTVLSCMGVGKLGAAEPDADLIAPTVSLRDALYEELASDADRFQKQYGIVKRVVRLVKPTIVHIDAYAPGADGQPTDEAGSGIILKFGDQYYILTNRHVVDTSSLANVHIRTDDGEALRPMRIWSDPGTDVAVIRVDGKDLLPARIGDSNRVEIGDFVLAVGSPFGLSHSVTYGIISAKGRWDLALGEGSGAIRFQDFLQTDAAINPGNSGGPLLNLRGEVIGINTAIASNSGGNEGIGFSIPIHLAVNVARQLISKGAVSTAYLGVRLDDEFDARLRGRPGLIGELGLEKAAGAYVKSVTPGSPAASAQLKAGDVITEFNGSKVQDDDHLINMVSLTPLNDIVSLSVVRSKREWLIHVRVGRRSDFETASGRARMNK